MNKINRWTLSCSILLASSCYYDNGEELYGLATTCDTANVTYSVQITQILSQNCYQCHGGNAANGAGIKLQDVNVVKNTVTNGTLLGSVKHLSGYEQMPKNAPKLSTCNIAVIEAWINKGAPIH